MPILKIKMKLNKRRTPAQQFYRSRIRIKKPKLIPDTNLFKRICYEFNIKNPERFLIK